jgi:hypothetical protein
VLTRAIEPDRVSRAITDAQLRGGYAQDDSIWTHAAVYLGDGLNVCEATFDSIWSSGKVCVTPIWDYCGGHAIRVRRSSYIENKEDGWRMAMLALTHLRKQYDFQFILRLAWLAFRGKGFWQSDIVVPIRASALVCSTLYADAHSKATLRVLGEQSGLCLPAFLSQCGALAEVPSAWLPIKSRAGVGNP